MKATALFISIMALCLLVIPMIAMSYNLAPAVSETAAPLHNPNPAATVQEDIYPADEIYEETEAYDVEYDDEEFYEDDEPADVSDVAPVLSFKILDQSTGKVNEIALRDYVRGAVAAEMPATFHSEAMKAQAVAAHTYALHSHFAQQKAPDAALSGADFAADPSNLKVYITEETAKEFYGGGEIADSYWNKICAAADSVVDYILEYEDEPIVAAYHAISAGQTEDAANVWSGSAPYLISVESDGDILAPGFETAVTMTADEVKAKLTAAYGDIDLSGDASAWFGGATRTDAGYVASIEVGGMEIAGKEIREIFGLRSHHFKVGYDDGDFVFTVTGYGHGVGLSQYGADFLARQGYSFDEILSVYYTGAALKTVVW